MGVCVCSSVSVGKRFCTPLAVVVAVAVVVLVVVHKQQQQPPFSGHYTGQPTLAGTSS